MTSLANNASAVARAHLKPRREKMFGRGEGDPARPQRQGAHHGPRPRADASDRGGEALRRADREVRCACSARCCGASTTPAAGVASRPTNGSRRRRTAPARPSTRRSARSRGAGILTWVNRRRADPGVGAGPVRPGAEPLARHPHEQRLHVRRSETPAQAAEVLLSPNFRLEPKVKSFILLCRARLTRRIHFISRCCGSEKR